LTEGEKMKKTWAFLIIILLMPIIYQSIPCYAAEDALLNVDNIIKNVDPDKITKAQFKEYFKTIEGEKAKGEGKVVNVFPIGKNNYRIMILTSASEPEKGYNVVLYTTQDVSSELGKNDKITFVGEVRRVNPYKGASIDIYGTYKKTGEK
jgi:hypothetical protein